MLLKDELTNRLKEIRLLLLKKWVLQLVLIGIIFFIGLSIYLFLFLPDKAQSDPEFSYIELVKAQFQVLAYFFGLVAIVIAGLRADSAYKIAKSSLKNSETALIQIKINEQGQITDRFSKAIEQLGNEKSEVRIGGIYALERIAHDSERDHWTIMQIFSSYLRNKCRINNNRNFSVPIYTNKIGIDNLKEISTEIQSVIDVLRNRKIEFDLDPENKWLNLDGTILDNYNFSNINLNHVDFNHSSLKKTNFFQANLSHSYFRKTDLSGSFIDEAILNNANFEGSNLTGVDFYKSKLCEAFFLKSILNEVNFQEVDIQNANMENAEIKNANLIKANLRSVNLTNALMIEAQLQESNLAYGNLTGADFTGSNLYGANLIGVKGLEYKQLSMVKTLFQTKNIPYNLQKKLKKEHPHLFEPPKKED